VGGVEGVGRSTGKERDGKEKQKRRQGRLVWPHGGEGVNIGNSLWPGGGGGMSPRRGLRRGASKKQQWRSPASRVNKMSRGVKKGVW